MHYKHRMTAVTLMAKFGSHRVYQENNEEYNIEEQPLTKNAHYSRFSLK